MNAYKQFAYYYDDAIQELDYTLWLDYITPYLTKDKTILDLACGSGTLAILLGLEGYQIEGLDLSPTIIEIAKEKTKINHLTIPYYVADMTNFKLDKTYDVITCFFDSVNFLQSKEDVKKMFSSVYDHLNHGGLFICDVFSKAMMDSYAYHEMRQDYQTYSLEWITKKTTPSTLTHEIKIIDHINEVMLQESYQEYFYDLLKLIPNDFEIIHQSGDFNEGVMPEDERLIFVLKRL